MTKNEEKSADLQIAELAATLAKMYAAMKRAKRQDEPDDLDKALSAYSRPGGNEEV